ncbi:unnamed protein product [Medioppia subpectinata]|uniref:Protein kinase domain-containing protein n=1 Tax=Medioppia subpectinata TaxID=1979941 RepID=A0A7R9KQ31_9ACAR|nr:unnamed protein product [Medioppia subpectinata]CAG2107727.1 unnamed protein product [Medioppia subpectinata]
MTVELLECIQYLHGLDPPIIHRDIKSHNVLISQNNNRFLKLCDFGLATDHRGLSMSHTLGVGTAKYMAPEVGFTTKYDIKVDIYSLGIIGHELFGFFENNID